MIQEGLTILGDIIYSTARNDEHFEEIILLQKLNHRKNLTLKHQDRKDFFCGTKSGRIKKMADRIPQIVAIKNGHVIGYKLKMDFSMQNELPMLTPIFRQFNNCIYKNKPLNNYSNMVGG